MRGLARINTNQTAPPIDLTGLARIRESGRKQRGGAWRAPSRWRSALVWGVVQARLVQAGETDLKRDEDDHTYG